MHFLITEICGFQPQCTSTLCVCVASFERDRCAREWSFVQGQSKKRKKKEGKKNPASVGSHLAAGLRGSLALAWVIPSGSGSSSFFCSPTHVSMADRLSLATCGLGQHSIDLRLEAVGVLLLQRGRWRRTCCFWSSYRKTLSTGFNPLSELCDAGCEGRVKGGLETLWAAPVHLLQDQQSTLVYSWLSFFAKQRAVRRQCGQNAMFKISHSINCTIMAKGMAL